MRILRTEVETSQISLTAKMKQHSATMTNQIYSENSKQEQRVTTFFHYCFLAPGI